MSRFWLESKSGWLFLGALACMDWPGGYGLYAADLDLQSAIIVTPAKLSPPEIKAVVMLTEEVYKRTWIRWPIVHTWPAEAHSVIAIGPQSSWIDFGGPLVQSGLSVPDVKVAEGFRIAVERYHSTSAIAVVGNDARGVLFGVGRLLRELTMTRGHVTIDNSFHVATAPQYPLRGHQLGYRPKTNSYDGWSLPIWEQYIRDLAVFGTNAVELIPPHSDDAPDSPHFPLPPLEMMEGMSRLLNDYGLDVWIWYPLLEQNYNKPQALDLAIKDWTTVFQRLPRVDAVFVPGGDPGEAKPRLLFTLLAKQAEILHQFHPRAQMWVSPQGFGQKDFDDFVAILNQEQLPWLTGVVFGPQVRVSLPRLRSLVPAKFPIRRYPDITHSLRCQYPVPNWDAAFALTEGREVINPRPLDQANIFRLYQRQALGFITYSEGCNDDVNKIVWSSLGWDPDMPVIDILRQYSRYFVGERYRDDFARGLLALESNWRGPLLTNESVTTTLRQFQALEKTASPPDKLNWRFQQALYRAYYDAYERDRLLAETEWERRAMEKLSQAPELGSGPSMAVAEEILDRAITARPAAAWRARAFELGEALFQSIRMQLSVERYQAIAVGRGATLDTIDVPLNNRLWLKGQFANLRVLENEREKLDGIHTIIHWTDPGPGGYYVNLGDPSGNSHVIGGAGFSSDPTFYQSPLVGFAYAPGRRISWCRHAESFYETPLRMRFDYLDGRAEYKLRVVYAGDYFKNKVRLLANEGITIHPYITKENPPRPLEFAIPKAATVTGKLMLSWNQEPGKGDNGRGCQVAEVWIIKKK